MFEALRTTFAKEALDLLRDRRALLLIFALPLAMPLLGAIGGAFMVWQIIRQTSEGLPVAVVNGEQLPSLVARLEEDKLLQLVDVPPDVEAALQSSELTALIKIPPDATERLRAEDPLTITLISSRGGWLPDFAVNSIQRALDEYADEILAGRLARRELDRDWMNPVRLEREAAAPTGVAAAPVVAGEAAPSSLGGVFLPLAITSWAFSGGLGLVAYMTVGEKERRTMESLLVTPASRIGVVLGKIALSTIASAITVGLWSLDGLAYVLFLSALPAGSEGFAAPISLQLGSLGLAVAWLALLMLPLMIMANGFVAAVCTFTKNYRESNLFLGILQLALPGLAFLATFGVDARPSLAVYALPAVGVLVAMRDLFQGGIPPEALAVAAVTAAVYATGAILLAAYVFSREWALMRGV